MIKRILRRILPSNPSDVDKNIGANIKRFKKTISQSDIDSYLRPVDWENKIEIVITCYNHAVYLESAFRSILSQTRKTPITVTFVNDNSSDDSLKVMRAIKRNNSTGQVKIGLINNTQNLNQAGSINKAVSSSTNKLFVMLNADDMLTPDCLALILATYKKHSDIALLGGSSLWFEDENKLPKHVPKKVGELKLTKYGPAEALNFTELNSINMSQSSCSFFKPAWELVGGYFERSQRVCSFDDRDFQMRVCSTLPVGVYKDYPMEFYRTISSQGKATV